MTSLQRIDVGTTTLRRHVPVGKPWHAYSSSGHKFETAMVNEPSVFEPLKFYCKNNNNNNNINNDVNNYNNDNNNDNNKNYNNNVIIYLTS